MKLIASPPLLTGLIKDHLILFTLKNGSNVYEIAFIRIR